MRETSKDNDWSVSFSRKLSHLNAKIEAQVGTVHRMGWIGFQIQVIKRLGQKDESQWPQNEVWVVPTSGGRVRVAAE